jgi:hypothetical protein
MCTNQMDSVSSRLMSANADLQPKSQPTFTYNGSKWVKRRTVSPSKRKTIRSCREPSMIVSPEQGNAEVVGDSLGTEEHRVMEWIRDCHEPPVDLMDDVPKIPGLQHFEFTDNRIIVYFNCTPRKSLRVCRS